MIASTKRYMTAFAAAALVAVAVSACGGGNGPTIDDPKPKIPDNGQPPQPTYKNVDLSGLMSGYMATAGTLRIDAGEHADRGDIRFTCAVGGADCVVKVVVTNGTITAMAKFTGGRVTAEDAPRPPPPKKDVDLSGVTPGFMADAVTMLEIKAGQSKVHGDIEFSCADDDCVVMVMVAGDGTITAMSSGGTVTASDAGDPNTPRDQALDMAIKAGHSMNLPTLESSGAPDAMLMYKEIANPAHATIGGWTVSVRELEPAAMGMNPAMTDTLVIYSNTDFETPTAFGDVYNLEDLTGMGKYDTLNVTNALSVPDAELAWVGVESPSIWISGENREGTFDGAVGMYVCVDVIGCNVGFDSTTGVVDSVMGTLWFTPDAEVTVPHADPDYMYFGYWLNESTVSDKPVFEVAGVYGGPKPSPIGDVQMLEGSATYEGSATGVYVRRWTDANSDVLRRRTGQFTADALLDANFGGTSIAEEVHYRISGTISNFMDDEDRAIDPSWRLALQPAKFDSMSMLRQSTAGSGVYDVFFGETEGTAADGEWDGQFFGEVDDASNPMTLPSGVAGTFDGHFNNGDVIGAFGAERRQ